VWWSGLPLSTFSTDRFHQWGWRHDLVQLPDWFPDRLQLSTDLPALPHAGGQYVGHATPSNTGRLMTLPPADIGASPCTCAAGFYLVNKNGQLQCQACNGGVGVWGGG
jgi:hypothetical protein